MTPSPRLGLALGVVAVSAIIVPLPLAFALASALLVAAAIDALLVRGTPSVERDAPSTIARGVASRLQIRALGEHGVVMTVRQPGIPDLEIDPQQGDGELDTQVVVGRRGLHRLPPPAVDAVGPLRLARRVSPAVGTDHPIRVYPDVPAARRVALAVRRGILRDDGRLSRGTLGLGTDFESIRDYMPDDEIRQVNWRATARLGRPMSNQYRVDQDRDVMCLLDTGRLMAAPVGALTRLDAALDAAVTLAHVADVVGDRVGVVAFDREIQRQLRPRRNGARSVVDVTFDLEPAPHDSDFEIAFRSIRGAKRAFVTVFTDLLDEAAASSLLRAVPLLSHTHAVLIANVIDADLQEVVRRSPTSDDDVMRQVVALDVLAARRRTVGLLTRAGAQVVEAPPGVLGQACVRAYLQAKARGRF